MVTSEGLHALIPTGSIGPALAKLRPAKASAERIPRTVALAIWRLSAFMQCHSSFQGQRRAAGRRHDYLDRQGKLAAAAQSAASRALQRNRKRAVSRGE